MKKLKVKGKVVKVRGGEARVEVYPPAQCEGCSGCGGVKKKIFKIPASGDISLHSSVTFKIDCSKLSVISFVAYFIPAFFLFSGFIAGYLIWGEAGGFIGGIIFMVLGSLGAGKLSRKGFSDILSIESE